MNTLPKDYVILGHIKNINVPKSWETNAFSNYAFEEHLPDWAYHNGDEDWKTALLKTGWMPKSGNYIIAALIGSPLYNMNLPKKKRAPTDKAFPRLSEKVAALEKENKKLCEQLAAIVRIING